MAVAATHDAPALRRAAWVLIALLLVLHLAAGYGTSGVTDWLRDLYWADAIVRGEALPVRGPVIYNTFELGPWWYYVVAAALATTGSLAGASAIASALAWLKYPLAWRLGRRLGGDALGLLLVAALVVPGWSAAPLGFPTHTALVEASLFALALVALRCRERLTWSNTLGFGLAAAFCAHAHPTTALAVAIAGFAVLDRHRNARGLLSMALAAAVVAASLLPPLLAHETAATDVGAALAGYAGRDVAIDPFSRALRIAGAIAFGGAWHGTMLLTSVPAGEWTGLAIALFAIATSVAGAVWGWKRHDAEPRWAAGALAIFLAQALFSALIRPITPLWMTSALVPPFAFALACGWRALARRVPASAATTGLAAAAWSGLGLLVLGFFAREVETVRVGRGPNFFMDAGASWSTAWDEVRVARVRLRRLERAIHMGCGATLHGDLAVADEQALGLPSRRACGDARQVEYGGTSQSREHVAGYLLESWCAIGLRPSASGSGFGRTRRVEPLAPTHGGRPAQLGPRQIDPLPAPLSSAPLVIDAEAPSDAVVALGKRLGFQHDFAIESVSAGGRAPKLLHETSTTQFYRCETCAGGRASWRIAARGNLAGIDFVALGDDPAGLSACDPL